jgi:membrane protein
MPNWLQRLEEGLFQKSRGMGPPWGAVLRVLRYPAALIRDWLGGELNIRAMSLAYTTLLSLVPLLVFTFAILKGLGARGDLKFILQEFFRPLGSGANQLTDIVLQFVNNMRGELLGSLGLGFLVYTVITTIRKIEGSFNFVWRIDRPRSIGRRLVEYLSVMILGPILLAVTLGLLGSAEQSALARWLGDVEPFAEILRFAGKALPYLIVAVFFGFVYWFIPNTHIEPRAAVIGGVTAGLIWALVGKVYTAVLLYSSRMVAVYTGFAIVLTTLIWVYLSWLILLIGAQLAFYLQFPQYLRHGQHSIELGGSERELVGVSIMYLIGSDYLKGETPWNAAGLAARLDLPGIALAPVLARLERAGLIVATEQEHFLPGRDLAGILLADILQAVRTQTGGLAMEIQPVNEAAQLMRGVESALRDRLGSRSLKDLITRGSLTGDGHFA